jgi:heptosyltransferase-3
MKILVSRTDRIGDVVLSLPVVETLKKSFPNSETYFLSSESTRPLIENQPYIDRVITLNGATLTGDISFLKNEELDIAVVLFPTFLISLKLFLAHIPIRIGTGFRWYSFLFNRKIFEHRRFSEKHEMEYNLNLIKKIGVKKNVKKPNLYIDNKVKKRAKSILQNAGVDTNNFIVVHPGSGGSSLTYPEKNYKILLKLLTQKFDFYIVLTGTRNEYSKVEHIISGLNKKIVNLSGKTDLKELAAVISLARLFIGSSTGPMHIASGVDTKVVAFFPPSRVNRKTRWGPLSDSLIFEPPVPYCEKCINEKCPYYNCLSLISPLEVADKIEEWYEKGGLRGI